MSDRSLLHTERLFTKKSRMNGRCRKDVDSALEGSSKFIAVDEQPNHQVVHAFRLGKTNRTAHQPLDPRPQIDMLALDLLGLRFAHRVLLGVNMPFVSTPPIGVKSADAKRFQ